MHIKWFGNATWIILQYESDSLAMSIDWFEMHLNGLATQIE